MPINLARLAILDKLFLVNEAIRLVERALNNAPTPDEEMLLRQQLADLQDLRAELEARRNQLADEDADFPPPPDDAMGEIQDLTREVQEATLAGAAAGASVQLAGEVLGLTITLLS